MEASPAKGDRTTQVVVMVVIILVLGVGVALLVWYFFDRQRPEEDSGECQTSGDCASGRVCVDRKCVETGGLAEPCDADGKCFPGFACTAGGICLTAEGGGCVADGDCASDFCSGGACRERCGGATPCPSGRECVEGACVPAGGFGQPCKNGGTCDFPNACAGAVCLLVDGQPCSGGTQCASGTCAGGICGKTSPECARDADCATPGQVCVNGACVAPSGGLGEPCNQDGQCETGLACSGGRCLAESGQSCVGNADCLSGSCIGGVCVEPAQPECQGSGDCPSGRACRNGRCLAENGQPCAGDADCLSGSCADGKCATPVRPECLGSGDCPSGRVCRDGRCLAENGQPCAGDADCLDGSCVSGVCGGTPTPEGGIGQPCYQDGRCDPGLACSGEGGVCLLEDGQPCTGDDKCLNHTCRDGLCAPYEPPVNPPDTHTGGEGEPCADGGICDAGLACAAGVCLRAEGQPCAQKEECATFYCGSRGFCEVRRCDTTTLPCPTDYECRDNDCVQVRGGRGQPCRADGSCDAGSACSESGTCLAASGGSCAQNSQCASGYCSADGACEEVMCTAGSCPTGYECSGNRCVSIPGEFGQPCKPDGSCNVPFACRTGDSVCLTAEGGACADNAECATGYCNTASGICEYLQCGPEKPCATNQACEANRCVWTAGDYGQACQYGGTCNPGLACNNLVCLRSDGQACSSHDECASGYCNATGECQTVACGGNVKCPSGQTCQANQCVNPDGTFARPCANNQCASGLECTNRGICLYADGAPCASGDTCASAYCNPANSTCEEVVCDASKPCARGYVCQANRCNPNPGDFGQPCGTSAPCLAGLACSGGRCLVSDGLACGTGGECASGGCLDGQCQPTPQSCAYDQDCGTGGYCTSGRTCAKRAALAQSCALDKCLEGLTCTGGFCQYPGVANGTRGAGCSAALPCDPGYTCRTEGGVSTCQLPAEGEGCVTQCDFGLQCSGGTCGRPRCYCQQGLCDAADACRPNASYALCEAGDPVRPPANCVLSKFDFNSGSLGSPMFAFSAKTTMPLFSALFEQLDPSGPPAAALASEEGLFSFTYVGLAHSLPAAVTLGGTAMTFESCSAGYALYRGTADARELYLLKLQPNQTSDPTQPFGISGYTLARMGEPITQDGGTAPVAISSFVGGRVLILAQGSSDLIFSSADTRGSVALKATVLEQGYVFDRPQLLGDNYFSVLAAPQGQKVVQLRVYAYQNGAWKLFASAVVQQAASFSDVTSYCYQGDPNMRPDPSPNYLRNRAYIIRNAREHSLYYFNATYVGGLKAPYRMSDNTVIGEAGWFFSDSAC